MTNILFITRSMDKGGTEKVVLQLCKAFKNYFDKIIVCSNGGDHEKDLEAMGIKHYQIQDIERKEPIFFLRTLNTIRKIVEKEQIDIIHSHHRMAAVYGRLIAITKKKKFIHTMHNIFMDKKLLTKATFHKAKTIAVGNHVKDNMASFFNIKDITVIHNCVESLKSYTKLNEFQKYRDDGYFLVGNIGRLSAQKGMDTFIRSIPEVLKHNEKFFFFLIGSGEESIHLELLAKNLGISEKLIFLGSRDDVQNIIKHLDIVILSSLWEGFPLIPIETFSVGKSIIATNINGTKEIVIDGYNGILIEPNNHMQLATSILKINDDSSLKNRLEIGAQNTFETKFSYSLFVSQYQKVYDSLIKGV